MFGVKLSARNKKKKKFADYVLSWKPGVRVAVIEAKDNNYTVSHGMQQALSYADILGVPSAFSSNGDAFASHNKVARDGEDIETEFPLTDFSSPPELWKRYKTFHNIADEEEELELMEENYKSPLPGHLQWRKWATDPEGITGEELSDFVNLQLFPTLKNKLNLQGPQGKRAEVIHNVFEVLTII